MDPNTISQITQYLDKLGDKLGIGTKMIWPWLVKQVYIDSALAWIPFLITAVIMFFTVKYALSHWTSNGTSRYEKPPNLRYSIVDNNHEFAWRVLLVFGAVCLFTFTIAVMIDGFAFLNPEYFALKKLMALVGNIKP